MRSSLAWAGDPGQSSRLHFPDRRGRRHDGAGMAGGRDLSCPQGRSSACDRRKQRRREYFALALAASAIAGASWIGSLATLSVSAQVALPDWVRARGLALYTTVFFGCLTIGSAAWGGVAVAVGLANAH